MKNIFIPLVFVFLFACGGENTASDRAHVGWDLDYRNWALDACDCSGESCTDDGNCSVPDLRGCDNLSSLSDGSVGLDAIDSVQIQLRHAGMTAIRYDQSFGCDEGIGLETARIRAVTARPYEMLISAKNAAGTTLYELPDFVDIDMTTLVEKRFTLPAVVGDLVFGVTYPDAGTSLCPIDTDGNARVDSLRYSIVHLTDETLSLTGELAPACEAADPFGNVFAKTLHVKNIPTKPTLSGAGSYVVGQYSVKVEAMASDETVMYCGQEASRAFNPGKNLNTSYVELNAGACP